MLVERIKNFISELELKKDGFLPEEKAIYEELHSHFAGKDNKASLGGSDYCFLEKQFARRWSIIKGTIADYTINPAYRVNELWIGLAKDLGEHTSKTYIKTLFPDITNTRDPISGNALAETENPDNLFLGESDNVLYRKKGLCVHLIKNGFTLSICREYTTIKKLSPITVRELTRLKACTHRATGAFKITLDEESGEESFDGFWSFLRQKVFPNLNKTNELPSLMMAHFLPLLACYFEFQKSGKSFLLFKEELKAFFTFLNTLNIDLINPFYGFYIEKSGKKYYLLDLLISLNEAHDYTLGEYPLADLLAKLYTINPCLRIDEPTLVSYYSGVSLPASVEESTSSSVQSRLMILSLFTHKFDRSATIRMWDRTHEVSAFVAALFKEVEAAIELGNEEEIIRIHAATKLKDGKDHSFLSFLGTPSVQNKVWFEHVKAGTLSSLGYYWFDPELLFHVLTRFRASDLKSEELIRKFLDELMHTYCQGKSISKYQKELRINILFTELLSKINKKDYLPLFIMVNLYQDKEHKDKIFISNVISYIRRRLGIEPPSPKFFPASGTTSKPETRSPTTVLDVVEGYKCMIKPSDRENVEYLLNLSMPILTKDEVSIAERSGELSVDPLGAAT